MNANDYWQPTPIVCFAGNDGKEIIVYWSTPRAKDVEAGRWMPNTYSLADGTEVEPISGSSYRIKGSGLILHSRQETGCMLLDSPRHRQLSATQSEGLCRSA